MILDFSKFTMELQSSVFDMHNVNTFIKTETEDDYMFKLVLTDGFFHIPLHKKVSKLIAVSCDKKYSNYDDSLAQGLSTSTYLM